MTSYTILITNADGKTDTLSFDKARVEVGRSGADIQLVDPHASGKHGAFSQREDGVYYEDLGSSNGSYLPDGTKITVPIRLDPGLKFLIGKCVIEVCRVGEEIAATQLLELPKGRPVAKPPENRPAPAQSPPPVAEPMLESEAILDQNRRERAAAAKASAASEKANKDKKSASDGKSPSSAAEPGKKGEGSDRPENAGGGFFAKLFGGKSKSAETPSAVASSSASAADSSPTKETAAKRSEGGLPELPKLAGLATLLGKTDGAPHLAQKKPASSSYVPGAIEILKAALPELVATFKGGLGPGGFGAVIEEMKGAVRFVLRMPVPATLVFGVLLIPNGIIAGLVVLVPGIAIVATVTSLAASLLSLFAFGALILLLARAHLGRSTSVISAWKAALRAPLWDAIALLGAGLIAGIGCIALLIPGLALAAFSTIAFVIEGHQHVDANRRSLEVWQRNRLPLLLGVLLLGIAGGLVVIPVSIVCGLIPVVGPLLGGVIGALASSFTAACSAALLIRRWFLTADAAGPAAAEATAREALG